MTKSAAAKAKEHLVFSPTFLLSMFFSLTELIHSLYSPSPFRKSGWFSYVSSPTPSPNVSWSWVLVRVADWGTTPKEATETRERARTKSFMVKHSIGTTREECEKGGSKCAASCTKPGAISTGSPKGEKLVSFWCVERLATYVIYLP